VGRDAGGSGSSLGTRAGIAGRRLQLLVVLLAVLLAIDAAVVVYDARQATFNTLYVATVGK
jgi:hypothetical protein